MASYHDSLPITFNLNCVSDCHGDFNFWITPLVIRNVLEENITSIFRVGIYSSTLKMEVIGSSEL
jgi:hypothetical protein